MKEFICFFCTDSTDIFSKPRSAGLNYNLPSFFTDSYCAGVSYKHCLLTFFISFWIVHCVTTIFSVREMAYLLWIIGIYLTIIYIY